MTGKKRVQFTLPEGPFLEKHLQDSFTSCYLDSTVNLLVTLTLPSVVIHRHILKILKCIKITEKRM